MLNRQPIRDLHERMTRLGIAREDLEEEFIRGSGPGGQKINKTSSTVRLRHPPTGVEVRCQEERSLSQNRIRARERLCEIIESRRTLAAQTARQEREKVRRQNRQRSKTQKKIMVAEKRKHSQIKATRKKPEAE